MNRNKRNRINNSIWVFFDVALFCFAVVFDSPTAWIPFYFLSFFLALNVLTIVQSMKKLELNFNSETILNFGEYGDFSLTLSGADRKLFYPNIRAEVRLNDTVIHSALNHSLPVSKLIFNFELATMPRGIYSLEGLNLSVQDAFGVFKKHLSLPLSAKVVVLPKHNVGEADAVYDYILSQDKMALSEHDLVSFDIKNIRSYQWGDRLNAIDWKLSSKKQTMMVKEFELDREDEIQFVFFGEPSKEFEPILSVFYSLYDTYLKNSIAPTFIISNDFVDAMPSERSIASLEPVEDDAKIIDVLLENLTTNSRKFIFSTLLSVELESLFRNHESFNNCIIFQRDIEGTVTAQYQGMVERVSKGVAQL